MKRFLTLILTLPLLITGICVTSLAEEKPHCGDVTRDGKVNIKDAAYLLKYCAGADVSADPDLADTNGDGEVNAKDAAHLVKHLTGWRVLLRGEGLDTVAETMKQITRTTPSAAEKAEVGKKNHIYYVSNDGDDWNDGLSPDTPFETTEAFETVKLKYGDVVLFRRGDEFRCKINCVGGVTYSSYGEGELPIINGSPYDGAVDGEWLETEYPNVYRYSEPIREDVGLITYNHGEGYIGKVCVSYSDGWENASIGEIITNRLTRDLTFFHVATDVPGKVAQDRECLSAVYVYSTEGNPADRFDNIEFSTHGDVFSGGGEQDVTVSNLHITCGGSHGVGFSTTKNLRVSYCEFSWIGGCVQYYTAQGGWVRYGNAIEVFGGVENYTVDHCYIHDVYDAGITHQYNGETANAVIMDNVTYTDNLIERCVYSFEYFNSVTGGGEDKSVMKNVRIADNVCRDAGGFGYAERPDKNARHIQGGWIGVARRYPAENFVIENNIFDRSVDVLVSVSSTTGSDLPVMRGNTYIQYRNGNYGFCGVDYNSYYKFDEALADTLSSTRAEENAKYYFAD